MTYYQTYREKVNWMGKLGVYATNFMYSLGVYPQDVQGYVEQHNSNPLVDELRDDPESFVAAAMAAGDGKVNMVGVCRAVVLVQMALFDHVGGPERDHKEKALRRHWYSYFKQFAQMFAFAIGNTTTNAKGVEEMNDLQWSGRLSQVYAAFVDDGELTYKQLWVKDGSRMMEVFHDKLYGSFNVILAVEKDSLYPDFVQAAKALGALAIISGKGKNSKAAAELLLRNLGWDDDRQHPFGHDPLYVLHISDHDYDGQAVIGPTFADQFRRYLTDVREARVGVLPRQVREVEGEGFWNASYQVKVNNKGYREWADKEGVFWGTCLNCGTDQPVISCDPADMISWSRCESCDQTEVRVQEDAYDKPHGFEVEALRSQDYYRAMVDALLTLVNWDDIDYGLRAQARPNEYSVLESLKSAALENNPRYQKIRAAIRVLEDAEGQLQASFDETLGDYVREAISETESEWFWLEETVEVDELKDHVVRSARSSWANAWRPFSSHEREKIVLDALEKNEEAQGEIQLLDIEDYEQVIADVLNSLE